MSTTPLHTHHGTRWGPWTRLGAWALSLMGLALAGTVALTILVSPAASAVTGLIATISHHDHSWSVVSATGVGVLLTALFLQQLSEGLGWLIG